MAEASAEFTVRGVESADEAARIEAELAEVDGVMGSTVDPDGGAAEVHFDVDLLAEERIRATVRELGYEVE
ncbi:heavy-metal-associated domain-containing protein [Halostella litorea]|uniref:heavy-metal-associated domain-containing protein n=1 Tax=Halostella litorea TaxID=2528831 RepID=UPI001092D827|nr:heavy-metal-associated domain-containing protein [Halostella litorea]